MYVAVKGGERAIENSHKLVAEERRGDPNVPELSLDQVGQQLGLGVDRVMTEGSLYDRELGALALKQARGDAVEAIFLLRAYRTTLPRFGTTAPIDTAHMSVRRRISAAFKDLPGGQILGPTYDYTHRLLDFKLAGDAPVANEAQTRSDNDGAHAHLEGAETDSEHSEHIMPRVTDILANQGLIEPASADDTEQHDTPDITRTPVRYPGDRAQRLQQLARGDEGWLLGLAYSTQRGFGGNHPFAGEIRMGEVSVEYTPPELGFPIEIGDITVTECQMINQFKGSKTVPPQFTTRLRARVRALRAKNDGDGIGGPSAACRRVGETATYAAQDEEFALAHSDNVKRQGSCSTSSFLTTWTFNQSSCSCGACEKLAMKRHQRK